MTKEETTRFWDNVQVGTEDECWPWLGTVHGGSKWGVFRVGKKWMKAHRVAYIATNGEIGDAFLSKSCSDPLCCNPLHMRLRDDFWSRVDKSGGDDACWPWLGSTVGRYGMVVGGPNKGRPAHHVAYEECVGPLPEKCILRRSCRDTTCCNPKHMTVEDCDFWAKVDIRGEDECWPWLGYTEAKGYGTVRFDGRIQKAHRVAYMLKVGPIPEGMFLLHSCDNPACCNKNHLSVGTKGDNNRDRTAKGRSAKGEGHACAALTDEKVREIRKLRTTTGLSYAKIAKLYGVHEATVGHLCTMRTWRHVV